MSKQTNTTVMKSLFTLVVLLLSFSSFSQDRGCSTPPHESVITAKVFTIDSLERPDQECIQYFKWQEYNTNYIEHNSNSGTDDLNWVLFIEPGEHVELDLKFGSEGYTFEDKYGYMLIESGELSSLNGTTYYIGYGSCHIFGNNYKAVLHDDAKLIVQSPVFTEDINIHVVTIDPSNAEGETVGESPLSFITQNTNTISLNFNSDKQEKIEVYSAYGELVDQFNAATGTTYNMSKHPVGIYFIQASINGSTLSGKCARF